MSLSNAACSAASTIMYICVGNFKNLIRLQDSFKYLHYLRQALFELGDKCGLGLGHLGEFQREAAKKHAAEGFRLQLI